MKAILLSLIVTLTMVSLIGCSGFGKKSKVALYGTARDIFVISAKIAVSYTYKDKGRDAAEALAHELAEHAGNIQRARREGDLSERTIAVVQEVSALVLLFRGVDNPEFAEVIYRLGQFSLIIHALPFDVPSFTLPNEVTWSEWPKLLIARLDQSEAERAVSDHMLVRELRVLEAKP